MRRAYRDLEARLRPFVARRVSGSAEVDDIVQDVFLRMHRSLPDLRGSHAQRRRGVARRPAASMFSPDFGGFGCAGAPYCPPASVGSAVQLYGDPLCKPQNLKCEPKTQVCAMHAWPFLHSSVCSQSWAAAV